MMEKPTTSGGAGNNGQQAKCAELPPASTAPELPQPKICPTQCSCPSPPTPTTTCFQTTIDKQQGLANQAENAKQLLAELNALNDAAKTAKLAYTADIYSGFKTRWDALNGSILEAIDTATCNIKCWWCLMECEVCSLLNQITVLDTQLNGDGTLMADAQSLLDVQYWHLRNVASGQARFDRFKEVLAAWSDPAKRIAAELDANEKLVQSLRMLDPVEQLLQLFLKVIPVHVALAPPGKRQAAADAFGDYLKICACDEGKPEDCCGPDTGLLSVLMQVAGAPLPYIVDPNDYLEIICCLVNERYLPAQEQLSAAQADLAAITAQIAATQADLDQRRTSLLSTALGNIAKPVDCSKYRRKPDNGDDDCADGAEAK